MKTNILAIAVVLAFTPTLAGTAAAAPQEIKGAAILEHPCGKVSVEHMKLINTGKFDDAMKLGSKAMLAEWNKMPAEDRKMMTEMMQKMSSTEAEYKAAVTKFGVLTVDGAKGTLVVTEEIKEATGTSTSTHSQDFEISGKTCLIGM